MVNPSWTVLREHKSPAPPAVQSFLRELHFTNPRKDPSLPSLVDDENGKIAGYLGAVPRKMGFAGNPYGSLKEACEIIVATAIGAPVQAQ